MLRRMSIADVVLVDRLELDFQAGLTVLTGETGAGKSIIRSISPWGRALIPA